VSLRDGRAVPTSNIMSRKFGIGFSWRRPLGISGALASFSRRTGLTTSQAGRQRRMGESSFAPSGFHGGSKPPPAPPWRPSRPFPSSPYRTDSRAFCAPSALESFRCLCPSSRRQVTSRHRTPQHLSSRLDARDHSFTCWSRRQLERLCPAARA
jgi:hypothetical protein